MKITIKNLTKSFGNKKIIDSFSYTFRSKGFYSVCGPSGCGKSTFLNIISSLLRGDNGEIYYDDYLISNKKEDELRDFRLRNIGYVFQSFSLFEEDTVYDNILVVNGAFSLLKNDTKRRKISEVLKTVGIEKYSDKLVKNLSGGEKQRVALARALVNDPRVIFADEPTGSLDTKNSQKVFEILKEISKKCLVIVVTHDRELALKYSDYILNSSDGKFVEEKINSIEQKNTLLNMVERKIVKKNVLNDSFISKHFLNYVKNHKIRFSIILTIVTISIFSLGLAFGLKENIASSLKEAFSSVMTNNCLFLERKNDDFGLIDYGPASFNETNEIYENYKSDLDYIGVNYLVNFEEFFKSRNELVNRTKSFSEVIPDFNSRSFNEFIFLTEDEGVNFKPEINYKLADDEIAIEITYPVLKEICKYLYIERTEEALEKFLVSNEIIVDLELGNSDWGYYDDFLFSVKAFKIGFANRVYHTNPLFNKVLFEDNLQFPSSENLTKKEELPWVMKKINYLKTKDFQSIFLNKIITNEKYKNYLFDSNNHEYCPKEYASNSITYTNKVFVYKTYRKDVPYYLASKFSRISSDLEEFYYSTDGGYLNLGTQMFSGFSNQTYFSKSVESVDEIIDGIGAINPEDISLIELPKFTLSSNVMNVSDENVRLTSRHKKIIEGEEPKKLNEVVISKKMAEGLGIGCYETFNVMQIASYQKIGNRYEYNFKKTQLKCVGIFNDEKNLLSGTNDFSISFFRDLLQVSSFNLLPRAIVFEFDEKVSEKDIEKLNTYYDEYVFKDPLESVDLGINDTLNYLQYVLLGLALMTAFCSVFLIAIINYIQIIELKKDYSILAVLGFRNSEISKLAMFSIYVPIFLSLMVASILLIAVSFLINSSIASSFGIGIDLTLSLKPFVIMFLESLIIVNIFSFSVYFPLEKMEIVRNIH